MKKALLVTHVSGFVPQFEMNQVKILQDMGFQVHYAANYNNPSYGNDNNRLKGTGIIRHHIDFVRSPYDLTNVKAYIQLKRLMKIYDFDLVHCHNPISGVIGRLAAHKTGTAPVIYTAHGFHFYRGAPLFNWLAYYPMEYLLSYCTDRQICINREDYFRAKKHFHAAKTEYIPGAGVDLREIDKKWKRSFDGNEKRKELGISPKAFMLVSVGELIKRKNHETIIRMMADGCCRSMVYVICGQGELEDRLKKLVTTLKLESRVLFLGYRNDVIEIGKAADLFVFPSFQEGLPMALLEAMAVGLPVVCSDIRGNRELVGGGGGILVDPRDMEGFKKAVTMLSKDKNFRTAMGEKNRIKAEGYSKERVSAKMKGIYEELWNGR